MTKSAGGFTFLPFEMKSRVTFILFYANFMQGLRALLMGLAVAAWWTI